MLFDQMHVLDVLKSAKVSLADDVAMARHSQQQMHSSGAGQQQDEDADFDGLLEFLEDPSWCVKLLHSSTKQVNYQHRVVGRMVQYICDSLTDKVGDLVGSALSTINTYRCASKKWPQSAFEHGAWS